MDLSFHMLVSDIIAVFAIQILLLTFFESLRLLVIMMPIYLKSSTLSTFWLSTTWFPPLFSCVIFITFVLLTLRKSPAASLVIFTLSVSSWSSCIPVAIRTTSWAYLRLLIVLPPILTPPRCCSRVLSLFSPHRC